jgi:hypothetical protein
MAGGARKRTYAVAAIICAAMLVSALLVSVALQPSDQQSGYSKGFEIGLEAYTYGLPLLVTDVTFETMTSINVSNGAFGPVNHFNNVRTLNNPNSTAVVAPGANSLSSIAWLDLSAEPQVLHVPDVVDHFYVLALIDPYTNNFLNLGSVPETEPGDYVIAGPGQQGVSIPAGTSRIDVGYDRIWIIGSTQLKGADDVRNVNLIQDGYRLTPLSKFGTDFHPDVRTDPNATVHAFQMPTGLGFFDMLGQQLELFPPPQSDHPALKRFAQVGIGPGMAPSQDKRLSADTVRGLRDAVAAGPAQIRNDTQALFLSKFNDYNGYLLGGFGQYGTDYRLRAVISQIGLGAFTSEQAIFAISWTDHGKAPLNGSAEYVLHMVAAPPVNEGWTFTVYNLSGGMVANAIDRYQLSAASNLTYNEDGSVDIYLQAAQPSNQSRFNNWLPTPSGQGFEVMWRLMAPEPDQIQGILDGTGWQPPKIAAAA